MGLIVWESDWMRWYYENCKKTPWLMDAMRKRKLKWWNENKERENAKRVEKYARDRNIP